MWAALPLLAMGSELDLTELHYIPPSIWAQTVTVMTHINTGVRHLLPVYSF
jgi:hypothetical protein